MPEEANDAETHDTPTREVAPVRALAGREFEIPLPSRGVLYDGKLPTGKVVVRPLTTKEEAVLYAPTGDAVTKINSIISACIVTRDVPPEELLMVDRFAILLSLRTASLGPIYEFPFRCRYCNTQFKARVNIADEFDIKFMEETATEPFETTLPICGRRVSFRLLRGKDETGIARHAKKVRMRSADSGDPSFIHRMAVQIVAVDGVEVNQMQAERFVNTPLDLGDSNALRIAVEKVESGIDTTCYMDCPQCGATNDADMPFSVEFFRPDNPGCGGDAA